MHFYQIPDGSASEPELTKLRDLADEFDRGCMNAFNTAAQRQALIKVATQEEIATMQGMMACIKSEDAKANSIELLISLQVIDVQTGMLNRADGKLAESCVPPAMATPAVADLFQKYDLPELEKITRQAIKPPTP